MNHAWYYLQTGPLLVCRVVILNLVAILLISYSVTPRSARSCWRSGRLANSFSISWLPVLLSKEDINWTLRLKRFELVTAPKLKQNYSSWKLMPLKKNNKYCPFKFRSEKPIENRPRHVKLLGEMRQFQMITNAE